MRRDISSREVVRLYRKGLSADKIARKMNCTHYLILSRLKKMKEPRRTCEDYKTMAVQQSKD